MPREVHFYECLDCARQFESWSSAEECEFEHDMEEK